MRKAISSIDELERDKTVLEFGGNFKYIGRDVENAYRFEPCFDEFDEHAYTKEQIQAFIRWGAITKPVEPRRFEGWAYYEAFTGKSFVVQGSPSPGFIRVLVTEVQDGEGE